MAKTLFHSELVKLSPVKVTVKGDVSKSKFKDKPDYVILIIGGEERTYNTENPGCADFFRGQKGRTFTVVAEGREADAILTYVGEAMPDNTPAQAANSQQPPARPATPPQGQQAPTRQSVPPPASGPTPGTPPPQNQPAAGATAAAEPPEDTGQGQHGAQAPGASTGRRGPTDAERVAAAKRHAFKIAQVGLISRRAAHWVATTREKEGEVMSGDQVAGLAATIMIQLVRDGFHQQMPDSPAALLAEPSKAQ